MTYYNTEKTEFILDGVKTKLTEEHAEALLMDGHDVEPVWNMDNALSDGAADELLECSCRPDLPDGRSFPLCPSCKQLVDEPVPVDEFDDEGFYIGRRMPNGEFKPQEIPFS